MASKTSIKILHVCTQDRGGAFQSAYNLHMGLLNEGIDSRMLSFIRRQYVLNSGTFIFF